MGGSKGGGSKGGGPNPEKVGPRRVGPKISRPVPPQNSFFSSLFGCLLVESCAQVDFDSFVPNKTTCNGSQGMEFCRHASRLVRGHSSPSSTVRAVAEGEWQVRRHRSLTGATSPWPMAGCRTYWSLEERRRSVPDQQILHQRRSSVWKQL